MSFLNNLIEFNRTIYRSGWKTKLHNNTLVSGGILYDLKNLRAINTKPIYGDISVYEDYNIFTSSKEIYDENYIVNIHDYKTGQSIFNTETISPHLVVHTINDYDLCCINRKLILNKSLQTIFTGEISKIFSDYGVFIADEINYQSLYDLSTGRRILKNIGKLDDNVVINRNNKTQKYETNVCTRRNYIRHFNPNIRPKKTPKKTTLVLTTSIEGVEQNKNELVFFRFGKQVLGPYPFHTKDRGVLVNDDFIFSLQQNQVNFIELSLPVINNQKKHIENYIRTKKQTGLTNLETSIINTQIELIPIAYDLLDLKFSIEHQKKTKPIKPVTSEPIETFATKIKNLDSIKDKLIKLK